MGDFARRIDAISLASLRETGATKWSSDDGAIGAFVAEMDFGVCLLYTSDAADE